MNELTATDFVKIQKALFGSGCFAFKKGEYFMLYREVEPKNVFVLKSKTLADFRHRASIAVGVKLP